MSRVFERRIAHKLDTKVYLPGINIYLFDADEFLLLIRWRHEYSNVGTITSRIRMATGQSFNTTRKDAVVLNAKERGAGMRTRNQSRETLAGSYDDFDYLHCTSGNKLQSIPARCISVVTGASLDSMSRLLVKFPKIFSDAE